MTRPLLTAEQRLAAHGAIERMQAQVQPDGGRAGCRGQPPDSSPVGGG